MVGGKVVYATGAFHDVEDKGQNSEDRRQNTKSRSR
jgi:hypothetical protein